MSQPPPKPTAVAPMVCATLLLVALAVWLMEAERTESLLSLEAEHRRVRELEAELRKKDQEMDGALAKIHELDPHAERAE